MKFCTDINGPQRMNYNQFVDPLTFLLAPPDVDICFLVKCLAIGWITMKFGTHINVPLWKTFHLAPSSDQLLHLLFKVVISKVIGGDNRLLQVRFWISLQFQFQVSLSLVIDLFFVCSAIVTVYSQR